VVAQANVTTGTGGELVRLSSGVPGFDALVQGGIPSGAAVIVQGPAGREKDTFLFQFIAEGLRGGGCALVVLSSVSPARYQQELRDAGVDVDSAIAEGRLKFVDWYSHKEEFVQDIQHHGSTLKVSIDLANVGIAISRAIAALPREGDRRAAVEVLSPALSIYDLREVYSFAQSTKAKLERFGFTSLFVLEKGMHEAQTPSLIHEPFDGVVGIERTRHGDRLVCKVAVISLKGTVAESKYVTLELGADHLLRVSADPARQLTLLHQAELIKTNPNDAKLWLATARNLRALGHHEQALRSVEGALKADARCWEAWDLRSEILEALGRHHEAEDAQGLATPPPAPPTKKPDHAARLLAFAERRLRNDPHDPDALFVTAEARAKDRDPAEAIAILEKLAEVDATYPGLRDLKTMLHAKRGELEKAQVSPARALAVEGGRELPPPPVEPPTEERAIRPLRPAPRPSIPVLPEQAPRGFTNGLGKDASRRTGRTNGLASGTRANGMTNGLATGRTNGMTNGLASGILSLRSGMTNGLTNGSGFTNGLGSARHRREAAGRRWKVYLIPILSVALLVAPLLGPSDGGRFPIAIDGDFSDWGGVPMLVSAPAAGVPPNVDLVRFGVSDNVEFLAFYFEVTGTALAGGVSPPIMDTFRAFLDVDRDPDTGYLVAGLGADRLVEVSGSGGRVQHAQLSEWDTARDSLDWGGWIKSTFLSAAAQGPRVEAHVDWLALASQKRAMDVAFHAMAYDGSVDMGEYVASTTEGSLLVAETLVVPETMSGTGIPLARFTLTAAVRSVTYDSLTITLTGTAPVSAVSELYLVDDLGADLGVRVPAAQEVTFLFPPRSLKPDATDTLAVVADVTGRRGETLGGRINRKGDIGAGPAAVSVVRVPGDRAVGYIGTIPTQAVVDGGFAEWTSSESDGAGEPGVPARIDLVAYSFYLNAQRASAYFRVSGRALDGAVVPALPAPAPEGGTVPPADSDRDRVPDAADPFPFDFNNDGMTDVATGNDYDADGILDYPAGPDRFLNATIPGTFPAAYAGLDVSVYIGPTVRPIVLGEDVARILIDADNETATGFRVDAIGADLMVEVRGKYNVMTSRTLSDFGGASPWSWTWTPLETVDAASAFGRLELSFDVTGRNLSNASRAYFELRDWSGAQDNGGQATYRLGTRGGAAPQPLDIGGNTRYWLRDTDHGTETDCNYNKVASTTQGSGPVQTISLSTGQSTCWYADSTTGTTIGAGDWETLLDLDAQDASNTTPSTETITNGSKVSGVFPTDIQTENDVFIRYRESTDSAEAGIAYRSNTGACATSLLWCPKTRTWDGSSWGAEAEQSTAGSPIDGVRMAWSPLASATRIIVTQSDDGFLDAYVCTPTCAVTNNIGQVWSTKPPDPQKRFDIAYEQISGDALLAYAVLSANTARDIAYKTFVGGTWSSEQYLDDATEATDIQYSVIKLASKRGSNQVGLVGGDTTDQDVNAWIWDGSGWGNFVEITASGGNILRDGADIAWESNSGHLLAVAAGTGTDITSKEFTAGWGSTITFTCISAGATYRHTRLKANPLATADDMVLAVVDGSSALNTCYWTGSAWANRNTQDTSLDHFGARVVDFAWESTGSKGLLVYGTSSGQITYRTFTAPNTWGAATNAAMGSNTHSWVQLGTNPFPKTGDTKILGAVSEDSVLDLGGIRWDGTTFTVIGASTFSADINTIFNEAFDLKYRETNDDQLLVRYDWTGVPSADSYTLKVKGYRVDENVNVTVLTPPSTWTTRITISATSNTLYTYTLTSSEYNSGAPAVRLVDADGAGGMQSDFWIDYANIVSAAAEYDVYLQIWNLDTNTVAETIGFCLDLTTRGEDLQCLVSGVAAKTVASNQVVRIRIAHSSALGTVRISYDDWDTTGDSRMTIPPPVGIPEFQDVVLPMLAMVLVPIAWRRYHRRRAGRNRVVAP